MKEKSKNLFLNVLMILLLGWVMCFMVSNKNLTVYAADPSSEFGTWETWNKKDRTTTDHLSHVSWEYKLSIDKGIQQGNGPGQTWDYITNNDTHTFYLDAGNTSGSVTVTMNSSRNNGDPSAETSFTSTDGNYRFTFRVWQINPRWGNLQVTCQRLHGCGDWSQTVHIAVHTSGAKCDVWQDAGNHTIYGTAAHKWPSSWTYVNGGWSHWKTCTECGATKDEAAHTYRTTTTSQASCTSGGRVTHTCTVCGYSYSESTNALGHDWSGTLEGWSYNSSQHWRVRHCARVYSHTHNESQGYHTWGSWRTTQAATCTASGRKERSCTTCGYTETDTIPALGHNWGNWSSLNASQHHRTCSRCGAEQTEAHNGSWSSWRDNGNGTHTRTYSCPKCSYSTSESEEHAWGPWQDYDGNQHIRHCTKCSATQTENHNYGDWSGWTDNGGNHKRTRTCQTCNHVQTETQEHSYGEWTAWKDAGDGNHKRTRTCSICGHVDTATEPHQFTSWVKIDGTNHERHCTVPGCGYKEIKAHNYGPWSEWKVNAKGDERTHTHTCNDCGYSVTTKQTRGMVFDHWNTEPDDSGDSFNKGDRINYGQKDSKTGKKITDLYAQWVYDSNWRDAG